MYVFLTMLLTKTPSFCPTIEKKTTSTFGELVLLPRKDTNANGHFNFEFSGAKMSTLEQQSIS